MHEIVKERRSITADTAERLARFFGGDAASWLNLQAIYDLKTLPNRDEIIQRIQPRISEQIAWFSIGLITFLKTTISHSTFSKLGRLG